MKTRTILAAGFCVLLTAAAARAEDDATSDAPDETQSEPAPSPAPAQTHRVGRVRGTLKARPSAAAPETAAAPTAADAAGADADGQRHAMSDDEKVAWYCQNHPEEGANCRAHALLMLPYISDYAQYGDSDTRGSTLTPDAGNCGFSPKPAGCPGAAPAGGGVISGGPLTGGTGPSNGPLNGKNKIISFADWPSAAPIRDGINGRVIANYNSYGPGTIFAMGFVAEGTGATWAWVENVNSSDGCTYSGWISAAPGGGVADAGSGNTAKPCGPDITNPSGSYRGWLPASDAEIAAKGKTSMNCLLKAGHRYYFNLQLVAWEPNPNANNIRSCIEYITPQGDVGAYYKN